MTFRDFDRRMMKHALALAQRGQGKTSPNPMVGAVIARDNRVLGEGFHRRAGQPHAEIVAIRDALRKHGSIHGATLYVTLEPCSTFGRTPPCTDAIMAAGIRRVVVGALDANPKHDGRGIKLLRKAGICVEVGLFTEEATRLNAAFNKWIATGLPLVIAKAAMSLDGKIAARTGDSKWITSPNARAFAHKMRANVDAVMVGSRTVICDNPHLTIRTKTGQPRGGAENQPWRVVVDSLGKTPLNANLYADSLRGNTLAFTSESAPSKWRQTLVQRGATVFVLPMRGKKLDLTAILRELARRDITSVLVEGGSELLGAMFDAQLVDKVAFFYAPKIIGGQDGVSSIGGEGIAKIAEAIAVENLEIQKIGKDWLVSGDVRYPQSLAIGGK